MTKLAAILFLALFLFNLIGYKCYFFYLQQQEQASFEASLDKETYDEKDLITFKVPLSIPYQIDSKDFERVDGEIVVRGTLYKYVKRKIEDGQLVLLCLPFYKKMNLVKAATDFGNRGNELVPFGRKGAGASAARTVAPNEYEENIRWTVNSWQPTPIQQYSCFILSPWAAVFPISPGKPPEFS